MTKTVRREAVEHVLDVRRSEELAAVRHERESRASRDLERRGEVRRVTSALIVAQPEPDDLARPSTGIGDREARERASLERVPKNLIDASADLGASPSQTFRTIIFPLAMPGIVAGSIFTLM